MESHCLCYQQRAQFRPDFAATQVPKLRTWKLNERTIIMIEHLVFFFFFFFNIMTLFRIQKYLINRFSFHNITCKLYHTCRD